MLRVDAANVVGTRPTGWWRDRPAAARELVEKLRLATSAGQLSEPVVVVLEGAARAGVEEGAVDGVQVVHAPRGGDETIIAIAADAGQPILLVSADRGLRRRAEDYGAEVVRPTWLLDQLSP
jgi:hypothetical protein